MIITSIPTAMAAGVPRISPRRALWAAKRISPRMTEIDMTFSPPETSGTLSYLSAVVDT